MNKRHKNANWQLPTNDLGVIESWDHVKIAVLMDIRDELQTLNRLIGCPNFTSIPSELRRISLNTTRKLRRDKKRA